MSKEYTLEIFKQFEWWMKEAKVLESVFNSVIRFFYPQYNLLLPMRFRNVGINSIYLEAPHTLKVVVEDLDHGKKVLGACGETGTIINMDPNKLLELMETAIMNNLPKGTILRHTEKTREVTNNVIALVLEKDKPKKEPCPGCSGSGQNLGGGGGGCIYCGSTGYVVPNGKGGLDPYNKNLDTPYFAGDGKKVPDPPSEKK